MLVVYVPKEFASAAVDRTVQWGPLSGRYLGQIKHLVGDGKVWGKVHKTSSPKEQGVDFYGVPRDHGD